MMNKNIEAGIRAGMDSYFDGPDSPFGKVLDKELAPVRVMIARLGGDNSRKARALRSLSREMNAVADVVTSAGLLESAKLLRMMASRAADAAETPL